MLTSHLENILDNLRKKEDLIHISIPGLWIELNESPPVQVNFDQFLIEKISEILKTPKSKIDTKSHWTKRAVVYNLFIRLFLHMIMIRTVKSGNQKMT